MSDFQELEYKYRADDLGLSQFVDVMKVLPDGERLDTSSWDIYYTKADNKDMFARYRGGDKPELTIKQKTTDGNNWVRIEVDLPLDINRVDEASVTKFLEMSGFKENFRIYKSCFIYFYSDVNYVYYSVYNHNMKEMGKFVEVEVNKNKVRYLDSADNKFKCGKTAIETLNLAAKELEKLGLTPQNRMKKSLFELFVK